MRSCAHLEFINLPLLVVLEFPHITLEFLTFVMSRFLLIFRGLDGELQIGNSFLQVLNLCANLRRVLTVSTT